MQRLMAVHRISEVEGPVPHKIVTSRPQMWGSGNVEEERQNAIEEPKIRCSCEQPVPWPPALTVIVGS